MVVILSGYLKGLPRHLAGHLSTYPIKGPFPPSSLLNSVLDTSVSSCMHPMLYMKSLPQLSILFFSSSFAVVSRHHIAHSRPFSPRDAFRCSIHEPSVKPPWYSSTVYSPPSHPPDPVIMLIWYRNLPTWSDLTHYKIPSSIAVVVFLGW